jgi:hypothetical protein
MTKAPLKLNRPFRSIPAHVETLEFSLAIEPRQASKFLEKDLDELGFNTPVQYCIVVADAVSNP